MPGNSFGQAFRVTTYGESHGPGIGVVIDGCPPEIMLDMSALRRDLARRRPGRAHEVSQRCEQDEPDILSGIFNGRTTGAPLTIHIPNRDAKPSDYDHLREVFRPGHADYTYLAKYGIRDHRGSGRASARETAARVAAGAVAKQILSELCGTSVRSCLLQMGDRKLALKSWEAVEQNPFFCPDPDAVEDLSKMIRTLRRAGDSCGALLHVQACGVPAGLGEPVFDRLDADLAKALMSINAVKCVEIGDGLEVVAQRGSQHGDEMTALGKFASNHAGGILGGISTGQDIVARLALKPTSSIPTERRTVDLSGAPTKVATKGRHDPCVGLRAAPIAEAMTALVLADHLLRQRGLTGKTGERTT